MSTHHHKPKLVEKEKVEMLNFPKEEVLTTAEEIARRNGEMERAMLLGNNHKGKVKIIFEDDECVKEVETTVWGFTDKRVLLKRELVIPIHRIHEIRT
jgi:uncharacterized protein (UPF0248 family)